MPVCLLAAICYRKDDCLFPISLEIEFCEDTESKAGRKRSFKQPFTYVCLFVYDYKCVDTEIEISLLCVCVFIIMLCYVMLCVYNNDNTIRMCVSENF